MNPLSCIAARQKLLFDRHDDEIRCSSSSRKRKIIQRNNFTSSGCIVIIMLCVIIYPRFFLPTGKCVWVNPFGVTITSSSSMKRHNIIARNLRRDSPFEKRRYGRFFVSPKQIAEHRLITTLTLTSSVPSIEIDDDDDDYIHNPNNDIQPRSQSIIQSFQFFIHFVIYQFWKNRHERYKIRRNERIELFGENSTWKTRLAILNQQRINLVILANCTFSIVAPSFFFLFVGALTTSIGTSFE